MLKIEIDREDDGRWIKDVPALPGVLAYGATAAEARGKASGLALRIIADRIEPGDPAGRGTGLALSRVSGWTSTPAGAVLRIASQ